ncbi:MAG TPA: hypothetical protein VJZ93_03455 [Candidatus Nanoarchaeia archaeon]|nr:hypothetical protein [Candidatus Nanoarchaeia archaeon]
MGYSIHLEIPENLFYYQPIARGLGVDGAKSLLEKMALDYNKEETFGDICLTGEKFGVLAEYQMTLKNKKEIHFEELK